MIVVTIVPRLPPAIDGVGDYALNLARQLYVTHGIITHFVIGDPLWTGNSQIEGFPVYCLSERSAQQLHLRLSDLNITTVLLHYVGYGYANRGCPRWLLNGLKRWHCTDNNKQIITMFHEVYASGHFLTSAFWLSPIQKNIAAQLAHLSSHRITSRQGFAALLAKICNRDRMSVTVVPVFSNIGEPICIPPLEERTRRLVIFGHPNSKLGVYKKHTARLAQVCRELDIQEICDVGVPTGLNLSYIENFPIIETGFSDTKQISDLFLDSIASFSSFPAPELLARSTVFAAYCAHQLLAIHTSGSLTPTDGLVAGDHYLVADNRAEPMNLDKAQQIANQAYSWYQTHSLPVQAEIFANRLLQ